MTCYIQLGAVWAGVMCSARLDLNSLDTEKGEKNLQEKNKEEHKGYDYYNYYYYYYWLLQQYRAEAHVQNIQLWDNVY